MWVAHEYTRTNTLLQAMFVLEIVEVLGSRGSLSESRIERGKQTSEVVKLEEQSGDHITRQPTSAVRVS